MDWLDQLGKSQTPVFINTKKKIYSKNKKIQNIKEYKADYYVKNIATYTERNRIASKKRTDERIDKLSDDDTIHKLKYVLENQ